MSGDLILVPTSRGHHASFNAMASRCEVLIRSTDRELAYTMAYRALEETRRIEQKYSRFNPSSLLSRLNANAGNWQNIDAETSALLSFSKQCFDLSAGMFDITAGPLLTLWTFGADANLPTSSSIERALKHVGLDKLTIEATRLYLPLNMSLDFGGIAKEYASDKAASLLTLHYPHIPALVNLGGDIACASIVEKPWRVGIEDPSKLDNATRTISLTGGGLATSGHTRRYLVDKGKRYGHILNLTTGYPVERAPLSVTVMAANCLVAGMLSSIAMLKGANAQAFMASQNVDFYICS
ncbi:FAD:protein FMN transferase [Shewanella violacea]|uniref:FAD:protein FMN transferase n=1 Tax=Shewanella violacea (strain JCM 10179 / CIP 106290 / LMG 19151 / DSS12) TaxID=637905 RepID=D4ZJW4_SHEVD|nr:FAD:protein FMN transferase [Shewanella violacea]BAJ01963.1 apbE family protein [Shewanella violacea DSS12]